MFEHFTDRARKVMALANQEAHRFNHEYIGTEHILIGILKEGSGVAAAVFRTVGVGLNDVRLQVYKRTKRGPESPKMGRIPQTSRAKNVLEYAIDESRRLNHDYVGTEHLLLGLLREEDGVAAQILRDFGLKLEAIRDEIVRLLGSGPPPSDTPISLMDREATIEAIGFHATLGARLTRCVNDLGSIIAALNELDRRRDEAVKVANYELAATLREQRLVLEERLCGSKEAVAALNTIIAWTDEIRKSIERDDDA